MMVSRQHRYLSVARTVFWRHMHLVFHKPELILPPIMFPLFFYAAFAGGLSAVAGTPGFDYYDYNAFQFVFVLLQSAAFGGIFLGFSIGADFDSGITRRLFQAAGDRSAVVLGYGMAAFVRTLMVWAVVFVIAVVTGMEINGGVVDLAGLFSLAFVLNIAGFLFAAGMMLRFRTLQAAPAMQIPTFMLVMTAPVYVPRDLLTGWIHSAAQITPATALMEAGRSLMAGDPHHLGLAFAAVTGMVVLLAVFAWRGLRQAEQHIV
jgi:ABC-2 type transport system permease protein